MLAQPCKNSQFEKITDHFTRLPVLGVGVSFRNHFLSEMSYYRKEIDFIEIIGEHFFYNKQLKLLTYLKDNFTIIPHGLSLSIGSVEGINQEIIKEFKLLVDFLQAPWFSDHIAFTRASGIEIGHLSPMPFVDEAVDQISFNFNIIQSAINAPLILENISYFFIIPGSKLQEVEFINRIVKKINCGLLLDVTNLYANCLNFDYNPFEFIELLPLEHIVQLHFTGGEWSEGSYIDTHDTATPEDVWLLMEEIVKRAPVKGIILERDDEPTLESLISELSRARSIGRKYKRWP